MDPQITPSQNEPQPAAQPQVADLSPVQPVPIVAPRVVKANYHIARSLWWFMPLIISQALFALSQLLIVSACLSLPESSRGECGAAWLNLLIIPAEFAAVVIGSIFAIIGIVIIIGKLIKRHTNPTVELVDPDLVTAEELASPTSRPHSPLWSRLTITLIIVDIVFIGIPLVGLLISSHFSFLGILLYSLSVWAVAEIGWFIGLLNASFIIVLLIKRKPPLTIKGKIIAVVLMLVSLVYCFTGSLITSATIQPTLFGNKATTLISQQEAVGLVSSCQVYTVFHDTNNLAQGDVTVLTMKNAKNLDDYTKYTDATNFSALRVAAAEVKDKCGHIQTTGSAVDNTTEDISVQKATELLNSCSLIGFYYTAQNGTRNSVDAESSSTGIVLAFKEQPLRIHIADRMVGQMLPVARSAQATCPNLQFWHDDAYER